MPSDSYYFRPSLPTLLLSTHLSHLIPFRCRCSERFQFDTQVHPEASVHSVTHPFYWSGAQIRLYSTIDSLPSNHSSPSATMSARGRGGARSDPPTTPQRSLIPAPRLSSVTPASPVQVGGVELRQYVSPVLQSVNAPIVQLENPLRSGEYGTVSEIWSTINQNDRHQVD